MSAPLNPPPFIRVMGESLSCDGDAYLSVILSIQPSRSFQNRPNRPNA